MELDPFHMEGEGEGEEEFSTGTGGDALGGEA